MIRLGDSLHSELCESLQWFQCQRVSASLLITQAKVPRVWHCLKHVTLSELKYSLWVIWCLCPLDFVTWLALDPELWSSYLNEWAELPFPSEDHSEYGLYLTMLGLRVSVGVVSKDYGVTISKDFLCVYMYIYVYIYIYIYTHKLFFFLNVKWRISLTASRRLNQALLLVPELMPLKSVVSSPGTIPLHTVTTASNSYPQTPE